MPQGPAHECSEGILACEIAGRPFPDHTAARGMLARTFCGRPWLLFPGLAGVLYRRHRVDGNHPSHTVTPARTSGSADLGLPGSRRGLHLRTVADFLLLGLV